MLGANSAWFVKSVDPSGPLSHGVAWSLSFTLACVLGELEKMSRRHRLALRLAKDERITRLTCQHRGNPDTIFIRMSIQCKLDISKGLCVCEFSLHSRKFSISAVIWVYRCAVRPQRSCILLVRLHFLVSRIRTCHKRSNEKNRYGSQPGLAI